MTKNKVMTLWTVIVTAFLALCTALGLATATATTATAAQSETPRTEAPHAHVAPHLAAMIMAMTQWAWSHTRALPPTMKQRIGAEAHGKSPSCRHRATAENEADMEIPNQLTASLAC